MVNPEGVPVNDALEFTSEESSSFAGVEKLEFVELPYELNKHISMSQIQPK